MTNVKMLAVVRGAAVDMAAAAATGAAEASADHLEAPNRNAAGEVALRPTGPAACVELQIIGDATVRETLTKSRTQSTKNGRMTEPRQHLDALW